MPYLSACSRSSEEGACFLVQRQDTAHFKRSVGEGPRPEPSLAWVTIVCINFIVTVLYKNSVAYIEAMNVH